MNKHQPPPQPELQIVKRREDLREASPHIENDGAAMQDTMAKIDTIARAEAANSALYTDFDWNDPAEEAIIVREQAAIAAYRNPVGNLVIRRQRAWDEEDDAIVIVTRDCEAAFLENLAKRVREA